jgi:cytoskeletal protein RodZ
MESYGDLLRKKREDRGLDFDAAERETSIAANYLRALENEEFDKFPGKVYFTGFLRTYGEYLGLDSAYLLRLFQAKMIQVAPVPTGLVVKPLPRLLLPLLALFGAAVVVGAVLVVFLVVKPFQRQSEAPPADAFLPGSVVHRLEMGEPLRTRLYVGDRVVIPGGLLSGSRAEDDPADVTLEVENTQSTLSLKTPLGAQYVTLGEEIELDVDNNPGVDVIVFLSDISRSDPSRGAEVRMFLKSDGDALAGGNAVGNASGSDAAQPPALSMVVIEDNRAYPFTLRITFREMCLLRQQVDSMARQENLYSLGAIVTMQANNGIRIWASNAAALNMQVIADGRTYDLAADQVPQVAVRDIRWTRLPSGAYHLVGAEID